MLIEDLIEVRWLVATVEDQTQPACFSVSTRGTAEISLNAFMFMATAHDKLAQPSRGFRLIEFLIKWHHELRKDALCSPPGGTCQIPLVALKATQTPHAVIFKMLPVSITDSIQILCLWHFLYLPSGKNAERHFLRNGGNYSLSAGKEPC